MKKCIVFVLTVVVAISIIAAAENSVNNNIEFTDETLPVDQGVIDDSVEFEDSSEFIDVSVDDWFYSGVMFVKAEGLMSGVGDSEFAPYESVTRGMLVVVLHRLEGEPQTESAGFADVNDSQWYANGISWAANEQIVNGTGVGMFEPEAPITREQIATILYKYSVKKNKAVEQLTDIIAPDKNAISDWAMEGMSWAVSEGLISGKDSSGTLDPGGEATRAEIATILMRFIKS